MYMIQLLCERDGLNWPAARLKTGDCPPRSRLFVCCDIIGGVSSSREGKKIVAGTPRKFRPRPDQKRVTRVTSSLFLPSHPSLLTTPTSIASRLLAASAFSSPR